MSKAHEDPAWAKSTSEKMAKMTKQESHKHFKSMTKEEKIAYNEHQYQSYYDLHAKLSKRTPEAQAEYWKKVDPTGNQKKQFDAIIAKRPPPAAKNTEQESALIHKLDVAEEVSSHLRPWWLGCCPCVGGN
uniref:Uncharacterized protein n=1 Tax=Florenciella parvula TaxID=236787 RepID=A0A7S2C739_9STRA